MTSYEQPSRTVSARIARSLVCRSWTIGTSLSGTRNRSRLSGAVPVQTCGDDATPTTALGSGWPSPPTRRTRSRVGGAVPPTARSQCAAVPRQRGGRCAPRVVRRSSAAAASGRLLVERGDLVSSRQLMDRASETYVRREADSPATITAEDLLDSNGKTALGEGTQVLHIDPT